MPAELPSELGGIAIPDWAAWVAHDEDGTWWAYEAEPNQQHNGWYENEVGRIQRLIRAAPPPDWRRRWRRASSPRYAASSPEPMKWHGGSKPAGRWTSTSNYHVGKAVKYPARRGATTGTNGKLRVDLDQDYCWMWTNTSGSPVDLQLELER